MGSGDWRGDETLDPGWHIPSEFIHGTFADYAVVPKRNAVPLPAGLSPLSASVLGTAWLTAYRALFTRSGLRAGDTVLIQGATGGMATALIQLGRAAGFEVWATSRTEGGRTRATALGAHRTFSTTLCHRRCARSSITSAPPPGRTASRRSPVEARW
jgi:NADPH:quinone reductase-like Zn-dependent oxidoreductase